MDSQSKSAKRVTAKLAETGLVSDEEEMGNPKLFVSAEQRSVTASDESRDRKAKR